jgi:hypothetical protein
LNHNSATLRGKRLYVCWFTANALFLCSFSGDSRLDFTFAHSGSGGFWHTFRVFSFAIFF